MTADKNWEIEEENKDQERAFLFLVPITEIRTSENRHYCLTRHSRMLTLYTRRWTCCQGGHQPSSGCSVGSNAAPTLTGAGAARPLGTKQQGRGHAGRNMTPARHHLWSLRGCGYLLKPLALVSSARKQKWSKWPDQTMSTPQFLLHHHLDRRGAEGQMSQSRLYPGPRQATTVLSQHGLRPVCTTRVTGLLWGFSDSALQSCAGRRCRVSKHRMN